MEDQLRLALIQTELFWEDVTANLAALEENISLLESVDVIVLPEMFNAGFSMNPAVAEPMNLTTTRWMKQMARLTNALLIGSFAIKEAGDLHNRLMYVFPDGSVQHYDKRHLFRMGQEHDTFVSGKSKVIVDWKGWNILGLVCYDLRFPVWSRNDISSPYDLLIYVANWPARRSAAWDTLLKARAIENQAYVAGVNRVGSDGNQLTYQGGSVVLDYLGEPLCSLGHESHTKVVEISKRALSSYRQDFPAYLDADDFQIIIQ